ncbi:MAG: hypothetical protein BGO98_08155 [Myxococcales bacterium 68-20]|nr:MAG: hypothetical protein BGO98_08155 [Myxococcales bacterium 68-20]
MTFPASGDWPDEMTLALTHAQPDPLGVLCSTERPMANERLKHVVTTHYGALRRAMRRVGVSNADLDDVLQEIFLVFTRRMAEVSPDSERSFLLQVGLRVVHTRQRAYVRRRETLDDSIDEATPVGPVGSTPEDVMSQREEIELLDRLLGAMPAELRTVLVLCEVEEATLEEAAQILDVKVGTVASRLFRARKLFDKLATRARAAQTTRSR